MKKKLYSQGSKVLEYYLLYCYSKNINIYNLISPDNMEKVFEIKEGLLLKGYISNYSGRLMTTEKGKYKMKKLSKQCDLKGSEKFILPLNNLRIEKISIDEIYLK